MNIRVPSLAGLAILALCPLAGAQSNNVKNLPPNRVLQGPKAVVESTLSQVPQINPVWSLGQLEHENPGLTNLQIHERNSLLSGDSSGPSNVMRGNAHFPAINATGWVPPDPDVAIGPSNVVATVNVSLGFYKKDGTPQYENGLGNVSGSTPGFFQSLGITNFVFDPKCFYDPYSKRFFVLGDEEDDATQTSKILIGVSATSDPNGTWYKYRIEAKQTVSGNSFWLDYPGVGFNKDAIVITGNMFGFTGGYNGIQFIVVPKAAILSGGAPKVSYFSVGGGSCQVARTQDPALDRVYAVTITSSNALRTYANTNLTTTPLLTSADVSVPSFDFPSQQAESVGGHTIDSLDGRCLICQYQLGRLLTSHTIQQSPSDPTDAARWDDINMNNWPSSGQNPSWKQSGDVRGPSGTNYLMPSIAMNSSGEIAMFMTRCSSSIVADMVGTAHKPSDPPGRMGQPVLLAKSVGATYGGSSNRWGDYFGAQVDPVDPKLFWGFTMVANANGGWITRVESMRVSQVANQSPVSIAMYEGTKATGTLANASHSDNLYYAIDSQKESGVGNVASAVTTFAVPQVNPTNIAISWEANAKLYCSTLLYAWNWKTGVYDYLGGGPLTTVDAIKTYNLIGNFSSYVNASSQMKLLFRAVMPISAIHPSVPFTYRIDNLQASVNF